MKLGRREFLEKSGACLLGAAASFASSPFRAWGRPVQASASGAAGSTGFGPLQPDPENILDLPKGFSYRIISMAGQKMKDGFIVPSLADGMAAFPGPGGLTVILRNHEFRFGHPDTLGPFGGK